MVRVRVGYMAAMVALLLMSQLAACGQRSEGLSVGQSASKRPDIPPCPDPNHSQSGSPVPCVSLDPQVYHESNRMFRQRVELSVEQRLAAEKIAESVRPAIQELQVSGRTSVDQVRNALGSVGLSGSAVAVVDSGFGVPQGGSAFGMLIGVGPGCVFGRVSPTEAVVEVGGVTREGGCLEGDPGH